MRSAAVAGYFYPGERMKLNIEVSEYLKNAAKDVEPVEALGGIVPHAGHQYSGSTAAVTFASMSNLKTAETVVLLGPNHSGDGSLISVSLQDWETPLGVLKCDVELAKKIQANCPLMDFDESAHFREHSIEVQLPFIQKINPKAKIVCICMMDQDYESAKMVGAALAKALNPKNHLVIASSDFSHYIPADVAEKKDKAALSHIEGLDAETFENNVKKFGWTICGYGPIAALVKYAKIKGSSGGKLLQYANSGKTSGDYAAVVGYASVVFPKGGSR